MTDFKFALRQLLKHKGASFLAILILALGIGGTTAVFSVADKVLLNPIPGHSRNQLFTIQEVEALHNFRWNVSPPLITELATYSNLIQSLTYCFQSHEEKKFRFGDVTVKLHGAAVAPNFFGVLGLRPVLGRTFVEGEGTQETELIIVISYGLWRQYFGGNPNLIGRSIALDGKSYSVVGIMPPNVQFPFGGGSSQFWIPRAFTAEHINNEWAPKSRTWMTLGRLRDGATLAALQAMLDVVAERRA